METQESRYEIHYQLANTNKMPIIQARCENVQLVSDRKALNNQKSDLHQQQDRACLKMQALKEILDNALLLSKKPINMVYFIKEQTFLREYFELSFEFLTIAIVYLL